MEKVSGFESPTYGFPHLSAEGVIEYYKQQIKAGKYKGFVMHGWSLINSKQHFQSALMVVRMMPEKFKARSLRLRCLACALFKTKIYRRTIDFN